MTANCSNCRFVKKPAMVLDNNSALACRRNPPMPMLIPGKLGLAMQYLYPAVTAKDWCGCHETAENIKLTHVTVDPLAKPLVKLG